MAVLKSVPQIFLVLFCLHLAAAWGNEGGGGEGAAASSAEEASPAEREYREKSAKLSGLELKIEELDKNLGTLVEEKHTEKNQEKLSTLLEELVKTAKERNEAVAEHRLLKKELLYRFPNKGEAIHQKYGDHQEASVEQLEQARGLEELLTETKDLIDRKYRPLLKDHPEVKAEKEKAASPSKKDKPLRLVK